jgi:hypothetical protein
MTDSHSSAYPTGLAALARFVVKMEERLTLAQPEVAASNPGSTRRASSPFCPLSVSPGLGAPRSAEAERGER